jgi:hypothetical protein
MSYQFDRAVQLERKLSLFLGSAPKGSGWLSEYRKWLEANDVPAEEDGWPSTQAYDDHHINLFVSQTRKDRQS